jgi:hypothetical protein
VTCAQLAIDTDKDIKADLTARYLIRKPHVAVFTELPIPKTTVSRNGVSYVFYGFLDYGVGLIKRDEKGVQILYQCLPALILDHQWPLRQGYVYLILIKHSVALLKPKVYTTCGRGHRHKSSCRY